MANSTVNPYGSLSSFPPAAGTIAVAWQNALVAAGGATSSVDAMNSAIASNLFGVYYTNGIGANRPVLNENYNLYGPTLVSILGECSNDYMDGSLRSSNAFSALQWQYIDDLLKGIYTVPIASIAANSNIVVAPVNTAGYLEGIQDRVAQSSLSSEEKSPLFMALIIGITAYSYWLNVVHTPTTPPYNIWNNFLDNVSAAAPGSAVDSPYNWINIPRYIAAAMEGCLLGYANYTLMDPPRTTSNSIMSMLAGAASINAGKVIFRWVPNGINPVQCC